ncbi:MAG TPA: hypothetical protein VLA82_06935 [Actinomycetota bacterium]|nr:hypothetical protein [Actinomycetota bacterium]
MDRNTITYAGVAGAVAGVVGLIGVYAGWWSTADATFDGTADASGSLALAMAIATFAFGGAYILMSDARIRRAMGALMTLTAVVLALAAAWGTTRADEVAPGAGSESGLWISAVGGILGIGAGLLALRDSQAMDAASTDRTAAAG